MKKYGSKVAWSSVCLPKKEGGLGIRRIQEWNKAAILKHIWILCSNTQSLWASWCKINLLKGRCFWEVKVPSDCSWNWRKLLNLRNEAITLSKYKVGRGDSISLWFSNWHPQGPLIPKYGRRIAYDAGIPIDAKVSCIARDNQWNWPFPCTWELREVILDHSPSYLPSNDIEDKFIWVISKSQCYNAKSTWEELREKGPPVHWHSLLWFPSHIPRHSFILWLAVRGRLSTKDKLVAWGMNVDPKCELCGQDNESMDHLFFSCSFSTEVRRCILQKCLISKPTQPWRQEVDWATGKFSGKRVQNRICKLAWAAMIYYLWRERNTRAFKGHSSTASSIVNIIVHDVKIRCSMFSISSILSSDFDFV